MTTYYNSEQCTTCVKGKDGELELANFTASIDEQRITHEADRVMTILLISGKRMEDGKVVDLPTVTIPQAEFSAMGWVNDNWGMGCVIYPHPSCERHLKTAIQSQSAPKTQHLYTSTGWTQIDGQQTYLTAAGGINKHRLNAGLTVQLPAELSRYKLPKPAEDKAAFIDSMRISAMQPGLLTPLILAAYRAAIGPADFALHLAGKTGTFKSEIASLIQSHWGAEMDARHLPASWSSTANAIEHLAYKAANAIMVLDDFVPQGASWQVKQLQAAADKIIRGQGNQAGRSRLTETSAMQQTYYPRGILLSTGEDVPEGHSVRARMLILETTPGDVTTQALTDAQAARKSYPQAMADWIAWLAGNDDVRSEMRATVEKLRDRHIGIGHSRTPGIMAELIATAELLANYAYSRRWLTGEQASKLVVVSEHAVVEAGNRQAQYLQSADPITAAMETIRQILSTGLGHAKTRNGGIPVNAPIMGWTEQQQPGNLPTYKANGPRIAWIDAPKNELYLDPGCYPLIKRHSGGRCVLSPQTFLKRLKDAGLLARTDDARQRNTVRVTLEGHPRQVIALNLTDVMTE